MTEAVETMSLAQGCDKAGGAISKASAALDAFIREVRESRSDLDGLIGELQALGRILNRVRDDADSFPPTLANHTPVVLEQCVIILNELEGYITVLNSGGVTKIDKKFRWIATRTTIVKLGVALQGYRSALGLAWDLVSITPKLGCTNTPGGAGGADPINSEGSEQHETGATSGTKDEVSRIMSEMRHLIFKVQQESTGNGAVLGLEGYLKDLQDQAFVAAGADWDVALINACHGSRNPSCSSDSGDDPDSAIELSDGPSLPSSPIKESAPPCPALNLTLEEIDEMLDELRDMVPSRAPTPPPRSRARVSSVRSDLPPSLCSDRRRSYSDSEYSRQSIVDALPEPEIPRRTSFASLRGAPSTIAMSEAGQTEDTIGQNNESLYSFMTRDSTNSSSRPSTTRKPSRLGRMFSLVRRQNIIEPPNEKPEEEPQPAQPGLVRRQTHRLSVVLHSKVPMFKPQPARVVEEEPNAVFGVSLAKSIAVARGTAKMNHGGSGSSKRDFPRCVFKCIAFIKEENGITTEGIFAEGGDPERVQLLRDIFSKAPTYGDDIDWRFFGVHEAAALIMLYLTQLKKPLVSESVVRRWVSLSRQAAMPGSHATRIDQCIDFWEEALSGIRGPARNLFKLLLNVWGDVADAADENDMTAERLAGAVIRPLIHSTPGKNDTDYLLGLAFLIRKRTEYTSMLKGNGKSNAAFEGAD